MDWKTAVNSFVEVFANLDFRNGPLFYVVGIVAAGYCCLEGYRIYKMLLGIMGFALGFRVGFLIFGSLGFSNEVLLMMETFMGLILCVVSYRIFLAGIFIAVFQFASSNLPVYVEALLQNRVKYSFLVTGVVVTIISGLLAFAIAKLSVSMTRTVLVCLTAVVGGFAVVNFLVDLIPVFPYEVTLPEPSSPIWLFLKIGLSAAGVGIQDVKDSPGLV